MPNSPTDEVSLPPSAGAEPNAQRAELAALQEPVAQILHRVYGEQTDHFDENHWATRLIEAMGIARHTAVEPFKNHWDQRDVWLITYGNSIERAGEPPLQTLYRFVSQRLANLISGIHVLPFFPYSSDDGFAVIDYREVDPVLGDWDDIKALASEYDLMADLVINHASSQSQWFKDFLAGREPENDFFYTAPPNADISQVVRPRSSPLLVPVQTADGERHVWCTFGPDQVDLNFANPDVLLEFVRIVRFYLEQGVRIFRLDAVAFLWKQPGTPSIHLRQTHELIRLLRLLVEQRAPNAIIVTETNVPNRDNLTYFGNGNQAHLIYNFSLPPLLIHTLISGDCRHLKTWQMSMPPAQDGTAYLNFIASHDGVGLRPAEGLLSETEFERLLQTMQSFGGQVSMRTGPDGNAHPYEINISLYDALKGTSDDGPDQWQMDRFIAAHTIMLGLEGIPALYIHSLLGTENDQEGVQATGRNRSINRHRWNDDALHAALQEPTNRHRRVFERLAAILNIRRAQPAFAPNATQFTMHFGLQIFAFWRQSIDRRQSIFCINNISKEPQVIQLAEINLIGTDRWVDLISDNEVELSQAELMLAPYQSVWLTNRHNSG